MSRGLRRLVAGVVPLCALLAPGCGLPLLLHRPPRIADCPGSITATRALPRGDYVIREQVHVAGEGVDTGFDVVAEKQGDRLVLVGLTPFGAKAFSVVQEGSRVRSQSFLGPMLPIAPENVLRDLHAAEFADPDSPVRARISRPGCGYTATLVRVSRRPLP